MHWLMVVLATDGWSGWFGSRADGRKAVGRDEKTATLQRQQSRIESATNEENRRDERRRE